MYLHLHSSEFDWKLNPVNTSTTGLPPRDLPPFSLPTSPTDPTKRETPTDPTKRETATDPTKRETTPLQIFKLFVTVSILELIVEQTRLYSVQHGDFLDFSLEDLLAFIGLNISMSMVRLPCVQIIGLRDLCSECRGSQL